MKKLNSVLLIDDNKATNLLHTKVIERQGAAVLIQTARTGEEALDFLAEKLQQSPNGEAFPDLIFLDINMPRMDGWEFLEEYRKRNYQVAPTVICMLSGSLNESDQQRASQNDLVCEYFEKPLTKESLNTILEKCFP